MIPKIVLEDINFLVIDKPQGLPSAPISKTDDNNAFSIIARDFPEVLSVVGKKSIEGGLVHRIDTDTRGLILIARNQTAYESFQLQQKNGSFIKFYTAFCEKTSVFSKPVPYTVTSRFRPFGEGRKMVQPVFENSGRAARKKSSSKEYSTQITAITNEDNSVKVVCKITEGYRHQVRAHLAYLGLPIINDALYGKIVNDKPMQFFASKLEFLHPITKNVVVILRENVIYN